MPTTGYSIASIFDVPAGATEPNIIKNKPGVTLNEPSLVRVFMTREDVDQEITITIGGTQIYPAGPVDIEAASGTLPSTQDNLVAEVFAGKGDDIIITAFNSNASPRQVRALVMVMPVDDSILRGAAGFLGVRV